jgi:hypothetical protein
LILSNPRICNGWRRKKKLRDKQTKKDTGKGRNKERKKEKEQEVLEKTTWSNFLILFNSNLNDLQRCDTNFALLPSLKASSNKIIIQIKLVGIPQIFYWTKLLFSKVSAMVGVLSP